MVIFSSLKFGAFGFRIWVEGVEVRMCDEGCRI